MQYIKSFKYCGNKSKHIDIIFKHIFRCIDNNNISKFIEPFGGSGVISLNAQKYFKETILNEIDINVYNIHKQLQYCTYKMFNEFYKEHKLDTLDLTNKQTYYEFRDNCNSLYFNKDDIKFGLFSYFIIHSCMNSLCRFGPNGFNQSYGNRCLVRDYNMLSYNELHKSYNNITLCNNDYKQLIEDKDNVLYYLDPPYSLMNDTYNSNFDSYNKNEFLNKITAITKSKIIYTDVYAQNECEILKHHGWKRFFLRNMVNIKPYKKEEKNNTELIEVLYTNF